MLLIQLVAISLGNDAPYGVSAVDEVYREALQRVVEQAVLTSHAHLVIAPKSRVGGHVQVLLPCGDAGIDDTDP